MERGDRPAERAGAARLSSRPSPPPLSPPFALADLALYVAILAQIGRVPLAVTTNLNINFLRKPAPGDVVGEARLMKLGKRLAVGEVALHSVGEAAMVAHATGTYSIPARAAGIIIPHQKTPLFPPIPLLCR